MAAATATATAAASATATAATVAMATVDSALPSRCDFRLRMPIFIEVQISDVNNSFYFKSGDQLLAKNRIKLGRMFELSFLRKVGRKL